MSKSILSLARRIQRLVEDQRPRNFWDFGKTLACLPESDHALMQTIEDRFGEPRCNRWMCLVLAGTTVFTREGEFVKAI